MECVFCKIIKGEVPSLKVYETDSFFAFLDIRPIELGHTLIIPKEHHRWVWDTPNIGEYFGVVKKIANAQKKVLNIEMVKSIIIGDEVSHAHVHLVPHSTSEQARSFDFGKFANITKEENKELLEKLINELE